MTAKEYLSQIHKLDRRINMMERKKESMRQALYGRATNYETDGSQHVSGGNSVEKALHKVLEYEEQTDDYIDKLVNLKLEIEDAISKVSDSEEREILELRYLCFIPYETHYDKRTRQVITGINDLMKYSERKIYMLHGEALHSFSIANAELLKVCSEMQLKV